MALWGTVACLYLGYELTLVQGKLSEIWPNRCYMIRSSLSRGGDQQSDHRHLKVLFGPKEDHTSWEERLDKAELWSVKGGDQNLGQEKLGTPWLIPRRAYLGARVRLNRLTPIWIELYSEGQPSVMLIYEQDQSVFSLYQYLIGDRQYASSRVKTPSTTADQDRDRFLSKSRLEELAYEVHPEEISCAPENLENELPKMLSLMLKDESVDVTKATHWGKGLWSLHAELKGYKRETIRRRVEGPDDELATWSISWSPQEKRISKGHSENDIPLFPPHWLTALLVAIDHSQGSPHRAKEQIKKLPAQVQLLDEVH